MNLTTLKHALHKQLGETYASSAKKLEPTVIYFVDYSLLHLR